MSGHIIFTVGNVRSGKSTFSYYWQRLDSEHYKVVVNPDNIRIALFGTAFDAKQLDSPLDSLVKLIARVMVKSLYDQGYFVCIDAVNCFEEDILTWLRIDTDAEFKYIDTPLETCLERGKQTGIYLDAIIKNVYTSLQKLAWISKDTWENPPQSYLNWDSYLPLEERINKSIEILSREIKRTK